jgi:hypothetical protein
MLAHHPITGQPIRILRTEPSIHCDQKTLVWITADFVKSQRWSRWYPLISSPAAAAICGPEHVNAVIIENTYDLDAWLSVLPTIFHVDSDALLIVPNCVAEGLRKRGFECDRTLLLEDLYDMYPYLGEPLKLGDPLLKIVFSIAHILRMDRVAFSGGFDREAVRFDVRAQHDAWKDAMNGAILTLKEKADDSCIPRTWLIQQYFTPTSNRRAREITTCLTENIACSFIDHILLLNEQSYDCIPDSEKITTHILGHRLTYADVLLAAQKYVPQGDYVLFSNSDIYFNSSLKYLWRVSMKESRYFFALLRWEQPALGGEPTIFGPRSDSQDSWACARDCLDFTVTNDEFGFPFGKSGCDNAITLLMLRKKFSVVNPAYSIRTIHVHSSAIRTYDPKDILYKTHYLYVDPTPIHPCSIVKTLDSYKTAMTDSWKKLALGRSFTRSMHSVSDDTAKTVCTMLKHNSLANYVYNENNLWTPPPQGSVLYNFRGGCFVTADGLVSDFRSIFVGAHETWRRGWESANTNVLTNSIHVPNMVAIPCDDRARVSLSSWVLYYLPRVLSLRKLIADAKMTVPEFLVPQHTGIGSFLNDCVWSTSDRSNITITPILPDVNYYSENVWAVAQEKDHAHVSAEDIDALRSLLPSESHEPAGGPIAVFCVEDKDSALVTRYWAESVVENVLPKGWVVRYVGADDSAEVRRRAYRDASWIIGSGDTLDWIWLAPVGATVMDFNREWEPRDDHIHLAGACGLRYVLGTYKREPIQIQRQNAMVDIGRAIRKFGFDLVLKSMQDSGSEVPKVIVPYGAGLNGIHSHCGDTFREMVELWGERGYVKVETREDTSYCWWGGVGQIVLYDRPTARWWNPDLNYQMALFGNCAPPGPGAHLLKQSVWGFWPRSPRAIEELVEKKQTMRGFADRKTVSLFLGKIENGVQHAARTGADWSKSVELFSMPIDSTGKPYPYSQSEYLTQLCNARYGLSLPGFGPKCNREIEYFACGVVPIVTPGVDMKGYLVPPKEGIHYLRVETPEQIPKLLASISAEKWTLMSHAGRNWWRTFASAEGLYRLTFSRIEQARPYFAVGIPKHFVYAA